LVYRPDSLDGDTRVMNNIHVSIIMPVFNAEKTIRLCLDSIYALNYPSDRYEVIVVDNGSTDSSADIISNYPVRYISKPDGTISSVRNAGALQANGEILAFVDSDCLVDKEWVNEALKILADNSVGVTGSGYLTSDTYTWVEKAWLYESRHKPFRTEFLPGGNLIARAEVFKRINGFDEKLTTSEDADFCMRAIRAGYQVINSCDIRTVHLGNAKTLAQFIKKEIWYGNNVLNNVMQYQFDKVFCLTVSFIIANVALLAGMALICFGHYLVMVLSAIMLTSIILTSGIHRVMRSKKYQYFTHICFLYYLYYSARTIALIKSIYLSMNRRET